MASGWFDRDMHRFEMSRFPRQERKRLALRLQVGEDVHRLLQNLARRETPDALRQLPCVTLVRQVFDQRDEESQGHVHWRDGPAVSNEDRFVSPSDPEARSSRKRELIWLGYQVHLTETGDQDPQIPHLIVQVHTVPATCPDSPSVDPSVEQLREQDLAPST